MYHIFFYDGPPGSKLNLQRYIQGVEPHQVECGLHWHRLQNVHVRWPVQQASEFDNWLSCTIKHTNGDFLLTSFLRLPADQPPPTQGSSTWPAISDREMVTTTGLDLISALKSTLLVFAHIREYGWTDFLFLLFP